MKIYYTTHETESEVISFTCIAETKEQAINKTLYKMTGRPLKTTIKQAPPDCLMTGRKRKRRQP